MHARPLSGRGRCPRRRRARRRSSSMRPAASGSATSPATASSASTRTRRVSRRSPFRTRARPPWPWRWIRRAGCGSQAAAADAWAAWAERMRDRDAPARSAERLGARTIADFGQQWTRFREHSGFYGSLEVLTDTCAPLLTVRDIRGARVAEIGSGTGRIVRMLLEAGAAHVVALEPSAAYDVLRANVADWADRVACVQATGD